MLARSLFRPARQVGRHIRRYANDINEPPKPKVGGGNNALIIGGAAAAVSAGAYYFLTGSPTKVDEEVNKLRHPGPEQAPGPKTFKGGDQGFVSLVLDSVDDYNHNVKKFRFKLDDDNAVSGLNIASALLTKFQPPDSDKPVLRPYTPTSDEDTRGYIDFVIKRYPNGPMSEHLHSLKPGESVDFKGPLPKYPWATNKHEHIALLAGGTGVTPMYQLCRAIFNNPDDKTKVTLVFGNISEPDILLKKEFEELENTYPQRFRAFYVLDNPPEGWKQGKGYITKELLKEVLPEPKEGNKIKIFVCGPPGMYKAISGAKKSPADQGELDGILKELGYDKDQVYKF